MRRGHPSRVASTEDLSGDVLLSHNLPVAVPSALKGLTSGFGMGPGISLSLWPPKLYGVVIGRRARTTRKVVWSTAPTVTREPHSGRANQCRRQALGLLVPVGSVYYYLRPPAYQPSRLLGALPGYPVGNLILKRASRLDAFSGYHFRT